MESLDLVASVAVAFAVGLLIGIERQQAVPDEEERAGLFAGGIRTYALFSLSGALAGLLARELGAWPLVVVIASLMALAAVGHFHDVESGRGHGLTSEAAFLVAVLLGALAVSDQVLPETLPRLLLVSAVGVVVTGTLSAKPVLHQAVERVSKEDLYATVKFLLVLLVLLPLLPDRTYGPLDVLNPFQIGLMVAFIAAIDFLGYASVRIAGAERGLAVTGILGGLVSSTAVTLSFSGRARKTPRLALGAAMAVVTASTIMFPRVLVEVAVLEVRLLAELWVPILAMAVAGAIAAVVLAVKVRRAATATPAAEPLEFTNPFELSSALRFGAVYAIVLFGAKAATEYLGTGGTYLAGVLAGTTDVDAVTLSMARLVGEGLDPRVGVTTIVLAAGSNTLVKAGIAVVLGGWSFGRIVLGAFAAVIVTGGAAVALQWLL